MKRPHLCRRPLLPTFCATWAFRWMRPEPRAALFLLLLLSLSAMTGCTIGPTVEVRHILIHPGQPLRVMKNLTVPGERLDGGGAAEHDIGGWIVMPPSHWAEVEKLLKNGR
jgi:hypothetical protein